ncbi:MAG TPA: sulfatase-like hydrolase/transferase [Myxococcaceae bacterium]|nr:sulfatase-like hydrolase/transferase [Myxococcaceae bacterium]
MESPAHLEHLRGQSTPSRTEARPRPVLRLQRWALPLIGVNLVALRLVVFAAVRTEYGFSGPGALSPAGPGAAFLGFLLLVQSLGLELLVLVAANWALGRPSLRWPARLLLFVFLVGEMAATKLFLVVHGYSRGFQLIHIPAGETGSVVSGVSDPWLLLATAWLVLPALWASPVQLTALPRRRRIALRVATVMAAVATAAQLALPAALPTAAYSPWLLTVELEQPGRIPRLPDAAPAEEDWAPARRLAPAWVGLAEVPRNFNVVVVVLESVRAETLWPSPAAPAMPRLAARAAESAVFTRAYAHEPWSQKGLEALLFGIYPSPFYASFAGHRATVALDSVGGRWRSLGLRTAFFGHGEIPFIGEPPFLHRHGFDEVTTAAELARLGPGVTDRTLLQAFGRFLDAAPGARFGTFLWPHGTHLPYVVQGGRAPPATLAAYRESVTALDGLLGELFDALSARGLTESTVVMLVGDHGESFGEHPASGMGHGAWLFEETGHVPLVLLNPRLFHGERDARIVQQKDAAATAAWLAGFPDPQLNLGSSIFQERTSSTAYLVNRYDASNLRGGMVRGMEGFVIGRATPRDIPPGKLFDLSGDPNEMHDLGARSPERLEAVRRRYFGWLETWTDRWMALEASDAWADPEAVARALHLPAPGQPAGPVTPAEAGR